ncbi:senescence-induced receptor-like serine/threonine-protein kinase isoform X2 [Nymphaea colorata]|uniref:senescence-induced receptor-like serine/threonine-protein kinase isoform X2 n=1 Tax=Nymphaea colorata TaxID=210225 RepID=UPI00129EE396|nr:senescence-induced receptor-like serine/threonine-protein kinase isoform X2 [Nymphaea colorata]
MVIHFKRNLFSFLIAAALFTSVVDGQYGSIATPPAQLYLQAVSSPPVEPPVQRYLQAVSSLPVPQAFPIQPQNRRELEGASLAPNPSSSTTSDGSIALPPAQLYLQAVSSPPAPPAFPIQPQNRRELQGPSSAPNRWSPLPPQPVYHSSPRTAHAASPPPPPSHSGVIVGSVVGVIAVIALIGAAVAWKYKKKPAKGVLEQPGGQDTQETIQSPKDSHAFLPVEGMAVAYSMEALEAPTNAGNGTTTEKTNFAAKESGCHAVSEVSGTRTADRTALVAAGARHFTYDEILSITGNFSRIIGEGGSSTVYCGQLPEGGLKVAVKKLKESGSQFGTFLEEIKILMRIHHKNLVSLVGLCEERDEIILVSEYMAGGSLSEILKARSSELTWRKRLQIAIDAATGLEYLHTGCRPAVIHRDIKPANILLDENLQAKLSDFGLSKAGAEDGTEYSAYQTKVAGTLGYIDPEYLYTQTLTKKSDVYSFGVVLLELITGKTAIMITENNEKCHLSNWVVPILMRGKIESLLDPLLKGRCNIQSVWEVAAIAKTATQQPTERPDVAEIIRTLKEALTIETSRVDMASVYDTMTNQSSFDEIPHNPVAR